jgi:hypothetical protein
LQDLQNRTSNQIEEGSINKLWQSIHSMLFFRLTYMEAEVAWYKEELRKWQDALLQSKGLPPVTPHEPKPTVKQKSRLLPSQWRSRAEHFVYREEKKPDA